MKSKSNDLDLKSARKPCFKISKNLNPNLGEVMSNSISKKKLTVYV